MGVIIPGTNVVYDPTIESALFSIAELRPDRVDSIRRSAKYGAFLAARKKYPNDRLVVRAALPTDFKLTINEWGATTGASADTWEAHQVANRVIDEGKFIAIYGCRYLSFHAPASLAITALRFSVGGALVAQWDLYPLMAAYTLATSGATSLAPVAGITESPIIISEKITLDIRQWVATATTAFVLALDAYVAEIEGLVLKP